MNYKLNERNIMILGDLTHKLNQLKNSSKNYDVENFKEKFFEIKNEFDSYNLPFKYKFEDFILNLSFHENVFEDYEDTSYNDNSYYDNDDYDDIDNSYDNSYDNDDYDDIDNSYDDNSYDEDDDVDDVDDDVDDDCQCDKCKKARND